MNKFQIQKNIVDVLEILKKTLNGSMLLLKKADEDLFAENFDKNIIVTGGCIASMLMDTEVNDYDIYIRDAQFLDTLKEVLINDFNYREFDKLNFQQKKDKVEEILDGGNIIKNPSWFVRCITPNAISIQLNGHNIQIITRFIGSPEEIVSNFDFVHATNYFTMGTGLVFSEDALLSLMTKELKFICSKFPLTSLIRIQKFTKRGFSISAGEILKIAFSLSSMDLTDKEVLKEQMMGVDSEYFNSILEKISGEINFDNISRIVDNGVGILNSDIEIPQDTLKPKPNIIDRLFGSFLS